MLRLKKNNPNHAMIRPLVVGGFVTVALGLIDYLAFGPISAGVTVGVLTLLFLVDATARRMEYVFYAGAGSSMEPNRVMADLRKSFCGRGVAICLYGDKARSQYASMGYRWYHVLPDRFPICFRRADFWKKASGFNYMNLKGSRR